MEPVNSYSFKEILEAHFKNLADKILDLRQDIKDNSAQVDKQFARLDSEIDKLRIVISEQSLQIAALEKENARFKVIWGLGATIGASLIAFFANKLF